MAIPLHSAFQLAFIWCLLSAPKLCCSTSPQVDQVNATPFFLGWVVASYSFGQLVASPLFGFWADKRPVREPMLVAMVINIVFSLLYCYCDAIPAGVSGYILIVSRAMVGFGAGIYLKESI